jgi:monovalent cation/hydrogen antiporter
MHPIEVILVLLMAAAAMACVAGKLGVPYALFLVVGGLALGFVPGLPRVTLEPQYVFVLVLPPLLYFAALQTSWRDFRANIRPIGTLAFGLTLFTTAAVAVIVKWLVPEFGWPTAFVLGAIVSPPDAVAATAVAERLRVPKRIVTILEGESLVNDAAAIVAYRIAVLATLDGMFSAPFAAGRFVLVAVGGVAVGLVVGMLVTWLRPKLRDVSVETAFSLLTPYLAYLPAEHMGLSGVLAVVTTGLYLSRQYPRIVAPAARLRAYAVWDTLVFILNCLVFILIGVQLPAILERLKGETPIRLLLSYGAVVSVATVLVRIAWVFTATFVPRKLFPSLGRDEPMPPWRHVFVVAWTGMRGIVSLAAALALPLTMRDGVTPFPNRDLILFLTFCVILTTLLAQGLTLPWIIRRLRVQEDGSQDREEEVTARYLSALAAIERLDALKDPVSVESDNSAAPPPPRSPANAAAIARVRAEYEQRIGYYSARLVDPDLEETDVDAASCRTVEDAQREALGAERRMLLRLRDDGVIGDEILRRVQHALDLEESRLDE